MKQKAEIIQTVLNTESDGSSMMLTTSHHYSGNITHPRRAIAKQVF